MNFTFGTECVFYFLSLFYFGLLKPAIIALEVVLGDIVELTTVL